MNYKIEDDIPIPANTSPQGPGRRLKYPLDQLEVGQSFLVPVRDMPDPDEYETEMQRTASRVANAANRYRKTQDEDFYAVVRRVEGGVRLWRVPSKATKAPSPRVEEYGHAG